jgi:phosphoglycerate kinase
MDRGETVTVTADRVEEWCGKLIENSPNFPALEECLKKIPPLEALSDLPAGTRVLVRGDTDVVFDDQGEPDDDARLRALVETLKFGTARGWVQILFGHRGRDPKLSLQPVAEYLKELLAAAGVKCGPLRVIGEWMNDDTGEILDGAGSAIAKLGPGEIVLLENTRKYKLEQSLWKAKAADLPGLAPKLAAYANGMREKIARVHVNEGFAAWGEGNDPHAPVFGALDPADQALRDQAVDSDTDRARGEIDDRAYRIDGQRPFVQQGFQHAEIREAEPGLFNTSGRIPRLLPL